MKLSCHCDLPMPGTLYLLDLSKVCSFEVKVKESGFDKNGFENIDAAAKSYVESHVYSTYKKNKDGVVEKVFYNEFPYYFGRIDFDKMNTNYTVVQYVGAGLFKDVYTGKVFNLFNVLSKNILLDCVYESELLDIEFAEDRFTPNPDNREDFNKYLEYLLNNPLIIDYRLNGLETITPYNKKKKVSCINPNIVSLIEDEMYDTFRNHLNKQYSKITTMDHAIALAENAEYEKAGSYKVM